jgi:hypothetical protein
VTITPKPPRRAAGQDEQRKRDKDTILISGDFRFDSVINAPCGADLDLEVETQFYEGKIVNSHGLRGRIGGTPRLQQDS